MDIDALLSKLNCSDILKEALNSATFLRPQVDIGNKTVTIRIAVPTFLDSELIEELQNHFNKALNMTVILRFDVADQNITVIRVMDYFNYFGRVKGEKFAAIPIIEEECIQLNLNEALVEKLAVFFADLGVRKTLVPIKTQQKEETEKVIYDANANTSYKAAASSSPYRNRRSRFTKKEDYLFMTMANLAVSDQKVWCTGKIFTIEEKNGISKKTGKPYCVQSITISDFTDAIVLKRFNPDPEKPDGIPLNEGDVINCYGHVRYEEFDKENSFNADCIEICENDPFAQTDHYKGIHHIDLHVHTNRSEMDGVSSTQSLVKKAFSYGSKAIAITDSCVVQAYPLAQQAHMDIDRGHPDNDFKIIYGIDVKMVDDSLRIVHNANDQQLYHSEFCVLDLETTGLSTKYDYIIEFGGVIVRNNTVTEEKLQIFVKPPIPIPPFIAGKTNITDEMVKNAQPIETAIDRILEFIGDRVIVAHNADFDFNFLNNVLERLGRPPLKNVCLDTLNLAREVVKQKKYYRLGVIANHYHVEYDEEGAHRGDYDAMVLAEILVRMIKDIPDYEHITYRQIQDKQAENIFTKAHTYSTTLLAKDRLGIKKIYELVSLSHTKYLTYFAKENAKKIDSDIVAEPRIPRSEILKRREHLFIGSCDQYSELFEIAMNRSMDDLRKCASFYDYIEIQPLENYSNLVDEATAFTHQRLKQTISDIIKTADELGKPIVGSNDVYYANKYEKIARDVYISAKRIGGMRHPLYIKNRERRLKYVAPDQHLMTTEETLNAFEYTGRAKEFVIDNPQKIADQIEKCYPIPTKLATPTIEGCEDILREEIYNTAHATYGDPLPEIVSDRIEKELNNVIKNGFSVQYYIAYLLVKQSTHDGYPVGSRGSVGSSFIATMANITEVNPLVPHYVCPKCKHSEFFTNNEFANGFDLPAKKCPVCGEEMNRNGHNIPFETFLGFDGDKVPDIDLNFSADYQGKAQQQIRDIFGFDYSYRAGTIGTVAQKTAFGYVKGYCEEMELPYYSKAYSEVLSKMCEDVKRTTGQHPGGIVVIPKENEVHDFTPIQYPANNPYADWLTTHYAFSDLHDNILKLDILGHVDPTAIRLLSQFSGVDYRDVPMSDPAVYSLFCSTEALQIHDDGDMYHEVNGAAGLPEFGTHNNRRILNKTKPHTFNELVAFEGVTHGTDVWSNNAEKWIDEGVCKDLSEVISCRDDIMTYLIAKGLDKKLSFDIMEKVRKGKGLKGDWIEEMKKHGVEDWYIESCQLIKYMFPKAHAVAYGMNAVRVAWYKLYKPAAYYAVYFSCRCDAYDIETMLAGTVAIYNRLHEIQRAMSSGEKLSVKEEDLEPVLEICLEMYLRGYHFNNISLEKSDAVNFTIDPDDDHGIIPSFNCIDGLGDAVANSIVEQRNIRKFVSKEDLMKRTSVNNTQIAFMEKIHVLDGLTDENQLSLF